MYVESLKPKVKALQRCVVFPEGSDPRPIIAASMLAKEGLMGEIILLGDPNSINTIAEENGVSLNGVTLIDYKTAREKERYIDMLFQRRKEKGMTIDQARELMEKQPLFTGAAMVATGRADCMVGGCINATGDVIRSALYFVGLKPGNKTISSFFIMIHPDTTWGDNGVFMYADCGVVPNPTAEQLADIAVATVQSYRSLVGNEPRVALLSFSTKGSAKDPILDKVIQAKKILDERKVDFIYDGEIQFDAAVIPSVAKRKCPGSALAGRANIFIFPDLNAGNICYKATERLAKCAALGPILQGALKPVNDLSRGCSAKDIADIALISALQV